MEEIVGDPTRAIMFIVVGIAACTHLVFIFFPGRKIGKYGRWERKPIKTGATAFAFAINSASAVLLYAVYGENYFLTWVFLISAILWGAFLITPLQHGD
jgi:hypothetical protein